MNYHFRNLVFEGGGVKGIAYLGAIKVLENKGILKNIKRVGGTSAGAINALLVGLNYSVTEMEQILSGLDFKNFLDDSWGVFRDANRVIHEYGWYKGDFFRHWISDWIKDKTGNSESTFDEVQRAGKYRELYFVGTNLSTRFSEVFSFEHSPRMCIADAVRISMSIPLFFAAKKSMRGDIYVDGGVLDNYPIKLFDRKKYVEVYFREPDYYKIHNEALRKAGKTNSPYVYNKETLGFRLDSPKEIAAFRDQAEPEHRNIGDFFDYAGALVKTVMNVQQSMHLHSDDWQRTIYIDTLGIGTTEFSLSQDKKDALKKSGNDGAVRYFEWYDNPKNSPENRP